jgi:hypothetical protein
MSSMRTFKQRLSRIFRLSNELIVFAGDAFGERRQPSRAQAARLAPGARVAEP